jgi:DNA-binding LacI/PurR family transcriptional regulator
MSRVLNNKATFSASPAMRQRILDSGAQFGDATDLAAQDVSRRTAWVIGMASLRASV